MQSLNLWPTSLIENGDKIRSSRKLNPTVVQVTCHAQKCYDTSARSPMRGSDLHACTSLAPGSFQQLPCIYVLPKLTTPSATTATHRAEKPRPGVQKPRGEARGLPPQAGQAGDAGDDRTDAPFSSELDARGTDLPVSGARSDRFLLVHTYMFALGRS